MMTNEGGWQGKWREECLANEQGDEYANLALKWRIDRMLRYRGRWGGTLILRWEMVSCGVKLWDSQEFRGEDEPG